jgi:hypothetical protein
MVGFSALLHWLLSVGLFYVIFRMPAFRADFVPHRAEPLVERPSNYPNRKPYRALDARVCAMARD